MEAGSCDLSGRVELPALRVQVRARMEVVHEPPNISSSYYILILVGFFICLAGVIKDSIADQPRLILSRTR